MKALASFTLVGLCALSLAGAASPTASTRPHLYIVSLGDSYTAGNGAGAYYPTSSKPDNGTCHRSYNAYPWQYTYLLRANGWQADIWHVACSGSVVQDITKSYKTDSGKGISMPAQINEVPKAFRAKANIVLLTIGGNDLKFSTVLFECLAKPVIGKTKSCDDILDQDTRNEKGLLAKTADALRMLYGQMPNAQIVLIGYPQLTSPPCATAASENNHVGKVVAAFDAAQGAMVAGLDRTLGTNHIHFVSVAKTFSLRGPCDVWGTQLIHNVVAPPRSFESFHPNKAGHAAIANLLYSTGVQNWVPSPASTTPTSPGSPTTSFAIGSTFRGRCTIAWPTAPTRTTHQIQMTMECPNVPESQYLLTVVIYDDPNLPVSPSHETMDVVGRVVDVAKSSYGFSELVVQATSIHVL